MSRLRLIGTEPPNAIQLSRKNNSALIKKHGKLTGQLLRLYGFNLNLCPVLDISLNEEADNSLKGRCYGESANQVITNAALFNKSMRSKAYYHAENTFQDTPLPHATHMKNCRQ